MNNAAAVASIGNRGPLGTKLSTTVSERLGPRRNFGTTNYDEIGSTHGTTTVSTNPNANGNNNTNTASYRKPNRNLSVWPADIFTLENTQEKWWLVEPLRSIDLSFNAIPSIPSLINQFTESLIELRISSNLLTVLPNEITELVNLRILDVSRNRLSTLPENLGNCTQLVELNVSSNSLSSLPTVYRSIGTPDLSSSSFIRLENFNLADNRITTVPDPFFKGMKSLRTVNLSNNPLSSLPSSLPSCSHLHSLNISRCQLVRIPSNYFVSLSELEYLDARQNALEELPSLPNTAQAIISEIYFGFNRIQRIDPKTLVRSTLTVIDIADNQIKDIPDDLRNCIKLTTFDISNNDINNLPAWLGFLPALVRIVIEGNPLRSMKRSFLGTHVNIGALKQYLKTRATPEEASLWEREIQAGGCVKFALQYPQGVPTVASIPVSSSSSNRIEAEHHHPEVSSSSSTHPQNTRPSTNYSTTSLPSQSATETAKSLDYTDHYNNGWEHALREVMNTNGKLILAKDLFPGKLTTITGHEFTKWTNNGINILHKITTFIGDHQSFGGINGLPLEFCTKLFPNLTEVSLMYNSLVRIPKALTVECLRTVSSGFCNLHTLKLANNQLDTVYWLPSSVTYLDLRYNNFTAVPNTLWTLPKLQTLLLGNNRLRIHMPSPSTTTAPQRLRIHSDDDLLYIPSLHHLDLSSNQFQRLPVGILSLIHLESLDISHNELPNIPVHLGSLNRLTNLNIDNNPQRSIRYNILEKGTAHLLHYLKSRIPEGEEYIYIEAYKDILPGGVHNPVTNAGRSNENGIPNVTTVTPVPYGLSASQQPPPPPLRFNNDEYSNGSSKSNNFERPVAQPAGTVPQYSQPSNVLPPNQGNIDSSPYTNNNNHHTNNSSSYDPRTTESSNIWQPYGNAQTNVYNPYSVGNPTAPSRSSLSYASVPVSVPTTSAPTVLANTTSHNSADPNSHVNILRRIDAIANELQRGSLSSAQVLVAKRELALLRAAEIRARGSL